MTASGMITINKSFHYNLLRWGEVRKLANRAPGVTKHRGRTDSLSEWDSVITALIYPGGRRKHRADCCFCLITLSGHDGHSHIYQSCMTADTHWLMPRLFSRVFFLLQENVSATGYQRPQTYIMKLNWASTAIKAHLQYQHSILQIIHSLLWILQTIRTLPGDWGNGSIWAFQTHSQGAVLVPSVASLASPPFIWQLAVQYLYLRSESTNKESAFTSADRPRSWEGDRCVQTWSCWSWARMPLRCQVLFWCRSIARAISECVALWRTSKWLRWYSLIVIETWTPPFLQWSLSASTPWSTQLFIKDGYRRVWGESRVFRGSQRGEIIGYHLRLAQLYVCLHVPPQLRQLQTVSQVSFLAP